VEARWDDAECHDAVVIDVVVLGSGTPNPTPDRAGSGLAVVDGAAWVLVDCGRAVTQRALECGLDLSSLVAVCLTHHHTDHISDLATLATTRWTAGAVTPLTVVAPAGPTARYAETCLSIFDDQSFHGQAQPRAGPRPSIEAHTFLPVEHPDAVFAYGGWLIMSALVDHHPVEPAVGYRIERAGTVVAVSGDTAVCDGIRQLATHADVLVHETLLSSAVPPSYLTWNAGARAVGELAASSHVGRLVLTHLIPAPTTPEHAQAFVAEARAGGYTEPIDVARDLLHIPTAPRSPGGG
jgi:ribonuclease Z